MARWAAHNTTQLGKDQIMGHASGLVRDPLSGSANIVIFRLANLVKSMRRELAVVPQTVSNGESIGVCIEYLKSHNVYALSYTFFTPTPTMHVPVHKSEACDNINCGTNKYRKGECSGRNNGYSCHDCSNKACSKGQYRSGSCGGTNNGYTCNNCAAGTHQTLADYTGSTCTGCQTGKFSGRGAATCTICPPGRVTNSGKTQCNACPAGKYATDGATCLDCDTGKISTTPVSGSCDSCGRGERTDQFASKGGSSCHQCASGKYLSEHVCKDCAAGYFQANAASEGCNMCPAGKVSPQTGGATDCGNCHSGKYAGDMGMSACVQCSAGYHTSTTDVPNSMCSKCDSGQFAGAGASSCESCQRGKVQPNSGQDSCIGCTPGKFQNESGGTACKRCGFDAPYETASDYTDLDEAEDCKQCDALNGETPTSNRGACTTCLNSHGPSSYLDGQVCKWCNGCVAGAARSECTEPCEPCAVGRWKDSYESSVNNAQQRGNNWDMECKLCTPCPPGYIRAIGDPCFGAGASKQGECRACAEGRYKFEASSYSDVCTECSSCHVGKSRSGCGGSSAGSCVAWEKPIITDLNGPGLSGFTSGGSILNVYGKYFGPVRSGADAIDIVVMYGPYTALDCSVVVPDAGLLSDNIPGNTGHIRCLTAEGVGQNHSLSLTVGTSSIDSYNGLTSETFEDVTVGYHPPIVATYSGPGSKEASTYGGQQLIVTGANFGPIGDMYIDSAVYGDGNGYTVQASNCTVTVDHVEMYCQTGPGGGVGNKLVVTIGGQASSIPSIDYGAPYLRTKFCTSISEDHGKEISGEVRCSCHLCNGVVTEDRTGTNQTMVPAISVGSSPCLWQVSNQNSCDPSSIVPTVEDVRQLSTLGTKGNQMIVLNGGNFGGISELERVSFGPSTGLEIDMPIYDSPALIPKSSPGCAILVPSFAIACNTKPGIAGPHKFVISVKGQVSQPVEVGSISYAKPRLKSMKLPGGKPEMNTKGSEVVEIVGSEFSTQDSLATYRVVMTKGPSSVLLVSNCADWTGDPNSCFEIEASKAIETVSGMERVKFITPSSFGRNWNVRFIISNSLTGQSTFVDSSDASATIDGSPIWLNYANPRVNSVDIAAFDGSTNGTYILSVSGSNFCDANAAGCGNIFVCAENCSNSTTGAWKEDPHRNNFLPHFSRVLKWTHTEIITEVAVSSGLLYVEIGALNDILISGDYQRSSGPPWVGFSTELSTIIAHPDSSFPDSGLIYRGGLFPTSSTNDDIVIYVRNLPTVDPNAGVTVVVNRAEVVDVTLGDLGDNTHSVSFQVPEGSGQHQEIYVRRSGMETQNRAYISYRRPAISTCVLKDDETQSVVRNIDQSGIISTSGTAVILTGTNLGDFSSNMNGFALSFISTASGVDNVISTFPEAGGDNRITNYGACKVRIPHTQLECEIPPGTGVNYQFSLIVGGQTPETGYWPQSLGRGKIMSYSPPTVTSVAPAVCSTEGGCLLTIRGQDFGDDIPSVTVGGSPCKVKLKNPGEEYHDMFQCIVSAGEGKYLPVVVSAGIQTSSATPSVNNVFSYDAPQVYSIFPVSGSTSGLSANGEPQILTIHGKNFGRVNSSGFVIGFETVPHNGRENKVTFMVPVNKIVLHTHRKVMFQQPEGFGELCRVKVRTGGQESQDNTTVRFSYDAPKIFSIAPSCGTGRTCFGYYVPQYLHIQSYPKIISITVNGIGIASVQMSQGELPKGVLHLKYEIGDKIKLSGVSKRVGANSGSKANFNGDWTVTKVVSADALTWEFNTAEKAERNILPDLYLGWNQPSGNLRALATKFYQSAAAASFQTLETDGCSATYTTADGTPSRSHGWETLSHWEVRKRNEGSLTSRQCVDWDTSPETWRYQEIVITGENFGNGNVPISITMSPKLCDCKLSLGGDMAPCMHPKTKLCALKQSPGGSETAVCPDGYNDCETSDEYLPPRELEIVPNGGHTHNKIIVRSGAGSGRRHRIDVTIGKSRYAEIRSSENEEERFLRYKPPHVQGFEKSGDNTVFAPDGKSKMIINGYNFGYTDRSDPDNPKLPLVEVRIGVEFDVKGQYCGDSENCMKIAESEWHAEAAPGMENEGFPYLLVVIPVDTAGFKNISVRIDGQVDDCRSNANLCGFPIGFPFDRRITPIKPNTDIANLIRNSAGSNGAVFTCATSSQAAQSYAKPGELCQNETNGLCADQQCLVPKANPGFWRLDLDIEWACNSGTSLSGKDSAPCQKDYGIIYDEMVKGESLTQSVISSLNPFDSNIAGVSGSDLCAAGIQEPGNSTQCGSEMRLCSDRGLNPPGACVFRRPEEARRALGQAFWPWACPTEKLFDLTDESKAKCRAANPDAFDYVASLTQPSCPVSRTQHLVDSEVYDEFPGLEQSSTCYGIVACSPKESCLGNNLCASGYEYNRHRCIAWNDANPEQVNCTSDDQCRSRSGSITSSNGASSGLSSACAYDKPEDCSRCIFADPTSSVGECKCMGGGPRCGLCTLRGGGIDPETGEERKGFYRLNDECQECPENPGLLIFLMGSGILVFCFTGWWLQDKKVNVAFLSIGVDYFQVLAIFARIKVRWPLWMKQILQVLSVFNFNIDITAPECIIPEFDYKIKWILMMSAPLCFAGVLTLLALTISLKKCIKFRCLGGTRPKYFSHMSKLVSMFIIIFYFLYLTVTRRALDIFNCNPSAPDDGYLYTEFTSIECPGGTCVCDDPAGLQTQLKPWAIICFLIYSIGFPMFVLWITWFYRVQIKIDQLLRAHDMGDERFATEVYVDARKCRSTSRSIYDIRKKYKDIYYHFKPGKVYWMLVVLTRKLLVALIALLFRRNVAFLLSCILLVLFASYVLQARHKPYMSQVEKADVIVGHRAKVIDGERAIQDQMRNVEGPILSESDAKRKIRHDLRMHLDIAAGIKRIKEEHRRKLNQGRSGMVSHNRISDALRNFRLKKSQNKKALDYYFDYNTVEQVSLHVFIGEFWRYILENRILG